MLNSCVDSGASSPPPLSSTRSGSTAATGVANAGVSSIPQLRAVRPQQQYQQHLHIDPSRSPPRASTSSSFDAHAKIYNGHGVSDHSSSYRHESPHWGSRPVIDALSPLSSPKPERSTAMTAAGANTEAAAHRSPRLEGSEGSRSPRPSSSRNPEYEHGDAGAAASRVHSEEDAGSGTVQTINDHKRGQWEGEAEAVGVVLSRSQVQTSSPAASTNGFAGLRGPQENTTPNNSHGNARSLSTTQTRSLKPVLTASACTTQPLLYRSTDSTPLSTRKTNPAIGVWMPYTPPGAPSNVLGPSEVSSAGSGAHAVGVRSPQLIAYTASSNASEASSTLPAMTLPVRSSPSPAFSSSPPKSPSVDGTSSTAASRQPPPPQFSLTPSMATEGNEEPSHVSITLTDYRAAASPASPASNAAQAATAARAALEEEEDRHQRRLKRRPPSLFVATPGLTPVASRVTATSTSPPFGKTPVLLSSRKADDSGNDPGKAQGVGQNTEAAASYPASRGDRDSAPVAGADMTCLPRSPPLPQLSRWETPSALLQRQTANPAIAASVADDTYRTTSPGCTTAPRSTADHPHVSSTHYSANPPSTTQSPASTGLITLLSSVHGGDDDEEEEEEDRGVGPVRDTTAVAEEDDAERHPRRHLAPQQQQQSARGLLGNASLSFSPPRPVRSAPLTTPRNVATAFAKREVGGTATTTTTNVNANSQSSSLTSHSIVLNGTHSLLGGTGTASGEGSLPSVPTASLHYGGSRAGSANGAAGRLPTFGFSPINGSFGTTAAHYVAGNGVAEIGGRAASGGTPSHSSFASPVAVMRNAPGTRPPPLALTPLPPASITSTTSNATTTMGSATAVSVATPGGAAVAPAAAVAPTSAALLANTTSITTTTTTTTTNATTTPMELPAPVQTTTRRRAAPPPSLFKMRSPVAETVTSPKSTEPSSMLRRASTASSGQLSTPPLNARLPVAIMGTTAACESLGGGGSSVVGSRTLGHSTTTTPIINSNHHLMGGSMSNRPRSGTHNGGSSNALVRLSHDRRTLIAGMFRVSRDGCLTVRNMLLLNPTRIDAAASTPAGNGLHGSPLVGDARRPVQLLHPQRTGGTNYSPVSSNGGAAGRMLMPHTGQGPATPNTVVSDWCSPQMYGSGAVSSAAFNRTGLSTGPRGSAAGYDAGAGNTNNSNNANPNASFTLFSTSMDTPFSPITYSLDSQRLAFPNSSGYQHQRGSGPGLPPGSQLLRAAREEHAAGSSSAAFGAATTGPHETTPTTSSGNYLSAGGHTTGGGGTQALPSSSTTHSRAGGAGSSLYRAQLRRQASTNWMSTMPTATSVASPTALQTAGSAGSLFGPGAFNVPEAASSLLMPYADIPVWKNGMVGVGQQASANSACSPATHTNPGAGSTGFTTTSTTGMNFSGTNAHGSTASQLPPNVVRLRDLDILATSVGEGASATVFVAIHKPTGRRLAVKRVDLSSLCLGCASPFLRSGGGGGNGRIRQLQQIVVRELQVLHLTYRSPFMVKVYNAFFLSESAALDIVMEFMHYGSLDHLASALQAHARVLRESQQQRHRLLFGDDDAGPLGSPGSGSDRVFTSPLSNSDGLQPHAHPRHYPHVRSPLEHALAVQGKATLAGSGSGLKSPSDGKSGIGGTVPVFSYLSHKTLNFGRSVDQQQVQLRGSRLGLGDTGHDASSPPGTASNNNISNNNNDGIGGGGGEGDADSLQLDTFSVKSNCGTDDTELDDGSGLMEEPFGVTERLVAVVGEQLLCGVRDMHSRGYIHRDIKPGNVLVNEHGVVKLSDFGLSQRCDDSGTGIKNPAMQYIPPMSTMPTRTNTPLPSPPAVGLPLGGNGGGGGGGGGGWASRCRSTVFSPYAQRSLLPSDNAPRNPLCLDATSPDLEFSSDGFVQATSRTNSVAAQRDGMDVLDAESTSSSSSSSTSGGHPAGRGAPSSSSSSSDAGANCSGTDKYMSPERQRGEAHGKPADIWAVGVTLAEFALGEYPYNIENIIDEFDRVSRLEKPVDVLPFNEHRAAPLSTVFADFIYLSTLPIASQRPTAQELLEHPFFKQWHKPFNLKDYLAARVVVPSNEMKSAYLAKQREEGRQ